MNELIDSSLIIHANEIIEYILKGNGRRNVPENVYLAAWEVKYAIKEIEDRQKYIKEQAK